MKYFEEDFTEKNYQKILKLIENETILYEEIEQKRGLLFGVMTLIFQFIEQIF